MNILGIDPSTHVMGFGIVNLEGNNLTYISSHSLKLNKKKDNLFTRLEKIHEAIKCCLISTPDIMRVIIEKPYLGPSPRTFGVLCEVLGLIKGFYISHEYTEEHVKEISPLEVRNAFECGIDGKKTCLAEGVTKLLKLDELIDEELPQTQDEYDALAVACAYAKKNLLIKSERQGV